jgi:putative flippase GtrA
VKEWLSQFGRFAVVGTIGTAVQYAILAAGVEWLEMDAVLASTAGFLLSAVLNYLLNRRYTYESTAPHATSMWRFAVVLASGLLLNALFMALMHGYLGWHYVQAQLLTTGINMIWNFLAHRFWTFARKPMTCG